MSYQFSGDYEKISPNLAAYREDHGRKAHGAPLRHTDDTRFSRRQQQKRDSKKTTLRSHRRGA